MVDVDAPHDRNPPRRCEIALLPAAITFWHKRLFKNLGESHFSVCLCRELKTGEQPIYPSLAARAVPVPLGEFGRGVGVRAEDCCDPRSDGSQNELQTRRGLLKRAVTDFVLTAPTCFNGGASPTLPTEIRHRVLAAQPTRTRENRKKRAYLRYTPYGLSKRAVTDFVLTAPTCFNGGASPTLPIESVVECVAAQPTRTWENREKRACLRHTPYGLSKRAVTDFVLTAPTRFNGGASPTTLPAAR